MCICVHLYMGAQYLRRSEVGFPGAGIVGSCALPNMGTGNQIWSSAGVVSPAQIFCFNTLILKAGVWLNSGALAGIYKAVGSIYSNEKN